MTNPLPMVFAGAPIDRADHLRGNPDALAGLMGPAARLLRLDGLAPVSGDDGGLAWGSLAEADPEGELVFLGLLDGQACFAPVAPSLALRPAPSMMALWQAMDRLSDPELALYGGAKMLVDWHARHRFCARCGAPTRLTKGGWQRNCTNPDCAAEHFPRVDPVTIMLVERGTLSAYRYLEHGAFWAIIVLGAIMLLSAKFHIPETVTGLVGAVLIGLSLWWSIRHNRRYPDGEIEAAIRAD